jgi:putative NADPH-quinone reductase/putative sterol carrier protein
MNVLLLRANPRKTGQTQQLIELFVQGLRETDARVVEVDLTTRSLLPCLGCFHCWLTTPGQCVHGDDMGALLEQVIEAEVLVCATPLYHFAMSSFLKVFFERTFPLLKQGLTASRQGGTRNNLRYPERWQGKKLVTLIVGALRGMEPFRPANETFRLIADSLDLELGGQLTRPESYLIDYPFSKPKTLKRIRSAFVQAGRETGASGRLSPETVADAALPLSSDEERFRTYSNVYWTQAAQLGDEGLVPAAVQARVAYDVRILMREMVRTFDARAAARLRAVLQFDFSDADLHYRLEIEPGACRLEEGRADRPDLRIECASRVWAGLFTRQTDVREALKSRQLVLEGDKSLFSRLERFFPPPSA